MSVRAPYRIQADVLTDDRAVLAAVADLGDYVPVNPQYNIDTVRQLEAALLEVQLAEGRIMRELDTIRAQVTDRAWAFHEAIKGVKTQVVAQYGGDSPALHAIGLKKRSEHRRRGRRKAATV